MSPEFGYCFASDNTAPATPETMHALLCANAALAEASYGADSVTAKAESLFRELFETDCSVYFCFTGTGANALCISAMRKSYESVYCAPEAHLERDETAAPEFFAQGLKLHLAGNAAGDKVSIAAMNEWQARNRGVHTAQPKVISLTQATELGTLYDLAELDALHHYASSHGLRIHMDGARFTNAVAALGVAPAELTWKRGVAALCFGGTKNGLGLSEAIVIFDPELAHQFAHRRKQSGQLASKMRLLSAPWLPAIGEGWGLKRAAHANAMASRLAGGLQGLGLRLAFPCQINGVFVCLPQPVVSALSALGWHFYQFMAPDVYRFMCAWSTTESMVDRLLDDFRRSLPSAGA